MPQVDKDYEGCFVDNVDRIVKGLASAKEETGCGLSNYGTLAELDAWRKWLLTMKAPDFIARVLAGPDL